MGLLDKIFGESTPDKQPVRLTDANFDQEVMRSEVPVVVDFWGPSCAPCAKLEPIIMKLAGKYDGRVKVCEASVPDNIRARMAQTAAGSESDLSVANSRL